MRSELLTENIEDQIKEAQIKLGYAKETMHFYYVISSINAILGTDWKDVDMAVAELNRNTTFKTALPGGLDFGTHGGRVEVTVHPEGVEYVHENVKEPEFLKDIIELFEKNHHCMVEDICAVFEKYSSEYVCETMPEGMDFDYVMYFRDKGIDKYCYCIKQEMGHTIYHRFLEEDYRNLCMGM